MTTRILLTGGPGELLETGYIQQDDPAGELVKVPHGAGYEHFAHRGENRRVGHETLPVYTWCGRTRIAE